MKTFKNTDNNNFESSFSVFRWRVWIISAIAAILFNGLLFLLLPVLLHPSSQSTKISKRIDHIQVIRLNAKEPPARKKKTKPPKPPENKPKQPQKVATPNPIVTPKLTLPFKLNTRLPAVSTDFQLPFADSINFGHTIDGSVAIHQLDAPLTPVARIPPIYPMRARRRGLEGWVRIAFEVDEQGVVDQFQILEAKPPGVFEKSVMKCVSKWRYKPGTVEGVPVRARMETTVHFKLD